MTLCGEHAWELKGCEGTTLARTGRSADAEGSWCAALREALRDI